MTKSKVDSKVTKKVNTKKVAKKVIKKVRKKKVVQNPRLVRHRWTIYWSSKR